MNRNTAIGAVLLSGVAFHAIVVRPLAVFAPSSLFWLTTSASVSSVKTPSSLLAALAASPPLVLMPPLTASTWFLTGTLGAFSAPPPIAVSAAAFSPALASASGAAAAAGLEVVADDVLAEP